MKPALPLLCVLGALAFATGAQAEPDRLLAIDDAAPETIYEIDLATGAATPVTTIAFEPGTTVVGLAARPSDPGTVYTLARGPDVSSFQFDQTRLEAIDLATGQRTLVAALTGAPFGLPVNEEPLGIGIAISPLDDSIAVVSVETYFRLLHAARREDYLFFVDLDTGAPAMPPLEFSLTQEGTDFDAAGAFHLVNFTGVWFVDLATGTPSPVVIPAGAQLRNLAFPRDPASTLAYAIEDVGGQDDVVTVDFAFPTAPPTSIGPTGTSAINGLTFIPEPSRFALLASGLTALSLLARRH